MNAERLLGDLIGSFLGSAVSGKSKGRRLRSGGGAVMNKLKQGLSSPQGILAAVGLAFGAYEAYQQSKGGVDPSAVPRGGTPAPSSSMPPPPPTTTAPPPVPPPLPSTPGGAAMPPPIPATGDVAGGSPSLEGGGQATATRLIQAMIAAAHADGILDEDERKAILGRLEELGLGDEERRFIVAEMDSPKSIRELTEGIEDHSVKRMMYGLSVAAIVEDSESETRYLEELAAALQLGADEVAELRLRFERKED